MDQKNNLKDKPRLVLYTIAGGYIFYQGFTLINSLIKKDEPFSKELIFYIFSVVFMLCGLAIFYYVFKSYRKQMNEMKKEQQMESMDEFVSNEVADKNDDEQ